MQHASISVRPLVHSATNRWLAVIPRPGNLDILPPVISNLVVEYLPLLEPVCCLTSISVHGCKNGANGNYRFSSLDPLIPSFRKDAPRLNSVNFRSPLDGWMKSRRSGWRISDSNATQNDGYWCESNSCLPPQSGWKTFMHRKDGYLGGSGSWEEVLDKTSVASGVYITYNA